LSIERRAVGPHDVLIDILYCGICHSDIHQAHDEWTAAPTISPAFPAPRSSDESKPWGAVSEFRLGDAAGVGRMVDSCEHVRAAWPTANRTVRTAPSLPQLWQRRRAKP
jgi:uncharacterized zinc-type alcohol dehydrogenase-like protein